MKDKDQTKKKLIEAVGKMVRMRGLSNIRISKVAKEAGVDRKLIYRYFGNLNNLIEAYIIENDYWLIFAEHLKTLLNEDNSIHHKELITSVLQEQFKFFMAEKQMQHLILLELSDRNYLMQSIHNVREGLGQSLLDMTDLHFAESNINFRSVAALLVGGIYYMILHTRNNGYKFSGIDLNDHEGVESILKTIANIVDWAYAAAESS